MGGGRQGLGRGMSESGQRSNEHAKSSKLNLLSQHFSQLDNDKHT